MPERTRRRERNPEDICVVNAVSGNFLENVSAPLIDRVAATPQPREAPPWLFAICQLLFAGFDCPRPQALGGKRPFMAVHMMRKTNSSLPSAGGAGLAEAAETPHFHANIVLQETFFAF